MVAIYYDPAVGLPPGAENIIGSAIPMLPTPILPLDAVTEGVGGEGWELHYETTAFGQYEWWEWVGVSGPGKGQHVLASEIVVHDISFLPDMNFGDLFGLLEDDWIVDTDALVFGTLLGFSVGYGVGFDVAVGAPVQGAVGAVAAHVARTYGVVALAGLILPGNLGTIVGAGVGGFQVGSVVGTLSAPLAAWWEDISRIGEAAYEYFKQGVVDWTSEGHELWIHELFDSSSVSDILPPG